MTNNIRYNPSAPRIRGNTSGNTLPLYIVEYPVGGGAASQVPKTVSDQVFISSTVTPTTNNFKINVVDGSACTFTSNTPSICTVDSLGNVARVANGVCNISVFTSGTSISAPSVRTVTRTMQGDAVVVSSQYQSWAPGSLAAHIDTAIRTMIVGKQAGMDTQAVLSSSTGNISSPAIIRNSNLFTGSLDLSAISVYTSAFGNNMFPVVLLSPWHLIAGHVGCNPGQQVVFKRFDGGYEVRTVVSQVEIREPFGYNDYVGILNAPITTIVPMPLLPSNWAAKLPSTVKYLNQINLPVLNKGLGAGDKIRILNCNGIFTQYSYDNSYRLLLSKTTDAALAPWSSDIIGGDSNGPVFVPINGTAALLHCMNTTNGGIFYPSEITAIQTAMNSLDLGGGTQTLSTVDLTGFNTY